MKNTIIAILLTITITHQTFALHPPKILSGGIEVIIENLIKKQKAAPPNSWYQLNLSQYITMWQIQLIRSFTDKLTKAYLAGAPNYELLKHYILIYEELYNLSKFYSLKNKTQNYITAALQQGNEEEEAIIEKIENAKRKIKHYEAMRDSIFSENWKKLNTNYYIAAWQIELIQALERQLEKRKAILHKNFHRNLQQIVQNMPIQETTQNYMKTIIEPNIKKLFRKTTPQDFNRFVRPMLDRRHLKRLPLILEQRLPSITKNPPFSAIEVKKRHRKKRRTAERRRKKLIQISQN